MTISSCPRCGHRYQASEALSRKDNRTEICPDCEIREALEYSGINSLKMATNLIKARYKPGMRVRLLKMNDFQAPPIGTEGTVSGVDDIGSVLVTWDNGCGLNVLLIEDEIEIIE